MGRVTKQVQSFTEDIKSSVTSNKTVKNVNQTLTQVGTDLQDAAAIGGKAVLLSLSKAWLGIGVVKPAKTQKTLDIGVSGPNAASYARVNYKNEKSETPIIDRFDTSKMWSMNFGGYYMPLSQTYTARAKKRLNVSSLVDGIDIVQQTRKEAKTVDCTLKISINESQETLQIVDEDNSVQQLAAFLTELYEKDTVFAVDNATLNDTFGLDYVIMSGYKFTPRVGSKTFMFEFSLTEIKYGDNVLTFDERQIQGSDEITESEDSTI